MRTALLDISTVPHDPAHPYSVMPNIKVLDVETGEELAELHDVHDLTIHISDDEIVWATLTTHALRFRIRAEGLIGKRYEQWWFRWRRRFYRVRQALKRA